MRGRPFLSQQERNCHAAPGARSSPGGASVCYFFAESIMYLIALRTSSSVPSAHPPLGGMARTPLIASFTNSFKPAFFSSWSQTLSPNLGAPDMPVAWQALQDASYTCCPVRLAAAAAVTLTSIPSTMTRENALLYFIRILHCSR